MRPYPFDEIADDCHQHVLLAAGEPDLSVTPLDSLLPELLHQDPLRLLLALAQELGEKASAKISIAFKQ